jgi:hypothetical protein
VAGHALRAGIAADPGCITVQIDWQNAFDTLSRDRMLAAVEERCPALLPMVAWAYKQPSRLPVHKAPGVVIHSRSGVRQGDPLGPLLFALTLKGPLEQVAAMNLARPLAYADDNFLQGAPEPTTRAFHALLTLAGPLGFHPKLDKCAVYSVDAGAAAAVASQLGVRHAPDGLLAAGTPVGTPTFQADHADRCAAHTCHLMEDLKAIPLADQDRWLLLHGSLQRRVAHLPRGCQWTHVEAAVQRAGSQALDCAFAILGLPRVDGPVTAQMTLHLRHGGLGLSCTSPAEGSAAYLAAAATTHQVMLTGPGAFRPFDGPSGAQLRTQWASLHDGAGTLWPPEYQEMSPESLGTIVAAQREFSRHTAQT